MGACWAAPKNTSVFVGPVISEKSQSLNCITPSQDRCSFSKNGPSPFLSFNSDDESRTLRQNMANPCLRIFSYSELKVATKNFRPETVLGEGGFGIVYKGWLDEKRSSKAGSGSVVAIKKLISDSAQGFEEWQSEVHFLGKLSHPNLVKLLGFCWEDKELLLVYEFMQKGSLENHLFGRGSTAQALAWNIRLQIAIGAAEGLSFLHSLENKIIYRDFKASNILIDGSFTAKISDFGLAKLGPSASQSHVTTRVIGTYGYAAPEYMATGHLYVKSDVYGFGIVLVEMLTGLRALDPTRPSGQLSLGDWIKPYLADKRKLKSIMDSRLEGMYPFKGAFQMAQVALKCLGSEPKMRPHMKDVVENLKCIQEGYCNKGKEQVRSISMASSVATTKSCGTPLRSVMSV